MSRLLAHGIDHGPLSPYILGTHRAWGRGMDQASYIDHKDLRHQLHRYPELSEQEFETHDRIARALELYSPDEILLNLGSMKTGVCAVFKGALPGPRVVLRCELDALPIVEKTGAEYQSVKPGLAHACGHDGHMATMVAVAQSLSRRPLKKGSVALLFQPAEETGTGASAIIADPQFLGLNPDYVFGFHNIPKQPLGTVLLRNQTFAFGSVGFIVNLEGRTSHSSYPEHGINPTSIVAELIEFASSITQGATAIELQKKAFATITSIELGDASLKANFGVAPGSAVVRGIVRGQIEQDIHNVKQGLYQLLDAECAKLGIAYQVSWHEEFLPTLNHDGAVQVVQDACKRIGIKCEFLDDPLRWSEDFGCFTKTFQGAFFGIGSGVNQPQLHSHDYDYPDELIPLGAQVYRAIVDEILNQE